MQINSVVIHEIIKEANTMQAEVFLTDELLDVGNEETGRILTSLEKSFTKHTPKRAKFLEKGFKDVINDFIVIVPNGVIGPDGKRGWNDCRSDASSNHQW